MKYTGKIIRLEALPRGEVEVTVSDVLPHGFSEPEGYRDYQIHKKDLRFAVPVSDQNKFLVGMTATVEIKAI